jgi:hypothetical protein
VVSRQKVFFANCFAIAKASGYKKTNCITNNTELEEWLNSGLLLSDTQFVEIRISSNSRAELGRPTGNPRDWKKDFMSAVNNKE